MDLNFINSIYLVILISVMVGLIVLSLIVIGIFAWFKSRNRVSTRLDQFITPQITTTEGTPSRQIVQREIEGSLLNRTVISWFKAFIKFMGRFTPQKLTLDMEKKLIIAGKPGNLTAGSFFVIRFFLFIIGVVLALFINRDINNISLNSLLIGVVIILVLLILPELWLKSKVQTRQDEILRGLPDALDMLSVCASAGLGFDQSLQKISGYWETELGYELKRVTEEMEMGLTRSQALRNMSERLEVDDLSRFVAILIQAEKIGMSYADVLHSQATQMRVMRQLRAHEIANKLPGKMIIPLALFIFPALIAVILGPAIPTIMDLLLSL